MKQRLIYIYPLLFVLLVLQSCSEPVPVPEKLPLSVKENLRYLQPDAQFIMYFNFRNMRQSEFWNAHISDSIFAGENSFGTLLNIFRESTGASISKGLDELYYSNSWIGDNAILMKGDFDSERFKQVIQNDSAYLTKVYPNGIILYNNIENGLYIFFKDKFTICSSNILSQIEYMMQISDTTGMPGMKESSGLYHAVDRAMYKSNIIMAATEKTFIRGIFLNYLESQALSGEYNKPDSVVSFEKDLRGFYERVDFVTFSVMLRDDLTFAIQVGCKDSKDAEFLRRTVNGLITLSKLSAAGDKEDVQKDFLNSITNKVYDKELLIQMKITDSNLETFRKNLLYSPPETE
ncbi:MAG: hypothetical protein UZ04_CHB001001710 [Chlorobi bacterium OLB4]|nr:MAG: hypothetical protein UZ04_CHB001001710 [Chlorobi bacterium OLB4]OQY77321.1 MAG: hypothetical protein B6D43_06840 [Ignavibacteriales bacterium UTCHB1]